MPSSEHLPHGRGIQTDHDAGAISSRQTMWLRKPEIGFELMHQESEIMIETVLRCLDQGVLVLPINDAVLFTEKDKDVARTAMLEAFSEYTGGFVARVSG